MKIRKKENELEQKLDEILFRISKLEENYQYISDQNKIRDDGNEAYRTECRNEMWMRTFGFDNMIAELQLSAVEHMFGREGNMKRLESLKDTHMGEKCFVIGNGPSLKAEDLDKLKAKGIYCFASNGIYNIFDATEWRPNIYAVSDLEFLAENWEVINELNDEIEKLICAQALIKYNIHIKNAIYFPFIQAQRTPRFFNKDVTRGVHFYGTVTGKLINFGVYMGFKEIYLLGCDNMCPVVKNENGQNVLDMSKRHFSDNYYDNNSDMLKKYENMEDILERFKCMEESYKDIKYFCELEQVKIINATRGGALEVFPRIDFENIKF